MIILLSLSKISVVTVHSAYFDIQLSFTVYCPSRIYKPRHLNLFIITYNNCIRISVRDISVCVCVCVCVRARLYARESKNNYFSSHLCLQGSIMNSAAMMFFKLYICPIFILFLLPLFLFNCKPASSHFSRHCIAFLFFSFLLFFCLFCCCFGLFVCLFVFNDFCCWRGEVLLLLINRVVECRNFHSSQEIVTCCRLMASKKVTLGQRYIYEQT